MIAELIGTLRKLIGKVAVSGFFVIIISLSLVQVNTGVYRAPEYFNKMIWFWSEDKVKTDYILSELPADSVVVANPSSVYLPYFAKGRVAQIQTVPVDDAQILSSISDLRADYLMIVNSYKANPFEQVVKTDEAVKKVLADFADRNRLQLVHTFTDDSVIYKTSQTARSLR